MTRLKKKAAHAFSSGTLARPTSQRLQLAGWGAQLLWTRRGSALAACAGLPSTDRRLGNCFCESRTVDVTCPPGMAC